MATETDIYPVGPTIDNANRLRATRGLPAIGEADEPLTPEQQSLGAPQQPDEQKQAELEGHVNGWIKSHNDLLLNEQFNQIKDKTAQKAVVDDLSANIESEVDALHDKGIPSFAITNIRSALDEQRKRSHAMIDAGDRPLTPQQINDELDKRHADLRDLPTGGKKEHAQAVYQAVSAALNSEKFKKGGHIAKHMGLRPDFVEKDGAILWSATNIEKELHKMANDKHWGLTNIVDSGLRSAISLAAGVAGRRAQDILTNITTANYDPKDPSEVATIAAYRDFEQEMKAKYNPKADMTGQFAGMVVGGGAVFKAVKGVTTTARSLRIVSRAAQALNMTQETWKTTGSLLTLGISAANLASSKHGTTFNPMEKGYLKDFALESVKLAMLHAVGAGTARLFSRSIVRAMAPTLQFNKWVGTGLGMSAAGATNWAGMRGMEVMEAAFGDSHKSFTDQLRDDWLGQMDYETLKRKGMPIGMWGGEVGLGAAAGGVGAWKGASSYADVMEAYRAARARADAKYHSGEFGFEAHNYVTSQIDDAYTNRMKPKQREAFLDDAERYRKIWNDSNGAGRDITDATEAYKTAESLRNSDSPLAATQADNSGDTSALIAQQKLMTALAKQKAKKKAAMEEKMLRGETPTEETKPSEPTTPAPHPIIAQIDSVVAAHASELAALGHPAELVLVTIPDESGGGGLQFNQKSGKIEYDPVRIEKVTIGMTPKQLAKYIRRGIAEEIIHVATDKYASESPENEAKLHAILGDAEAVAAAEKAYGKNAFEKLNETQKAFEVARVLIQGPRALTEAAYRFFKDLLRWLAQKVKNLSPETKELLDGIKAKMEAHKSGKVEEATPKVAGDANYKPEPAKESEPKNEKAQSVPSVQKADESVRLPQAEVTPAAPSPEPVTPAAASHAQTAKEWESANKRKLPQNRAPIPESLSLPVGTVVRAKNYGENEGDIVITGPLRVNTSGIIEYPADFTGSGRMASVEANEITEIKPAAAKPVEAERNLAPLTEAERSLAESLAKKYGMPVLPAVQAKGEIENLSRFSNMLERAADKSNDETELAQILSAAKGRIDESRIANAVANNPHSSEATFSEAKANSERQKMAGDESIAYLNARRAELRKQRGLDAQPAAAPAAEQPAPAPIEQAIADANWRGTVREVPAPRSMGGEGVKLYIPVDASGKDVSVGGQTILGKTPAEAIELAQKNAKPAPAPAAAPAKTQRAMSDSEIEGVRKAQMPVIEDATSGIKERYESALGKKLTGDQVFDLAVKITKGIHQKGGRANIQDILDSARKDQIVSAAAPAPAEAQAKEPWEMTKAEAAEDIRKTHQAAMVKAQQTGEPWDRSWRGQGGRAWGWLTEPHEQAIRIALREGKPVPAEVLADYPDLAKQPLAPATPQAEGGIFGYAWADIRSKQQGGKLAALIRGNAPKATESDFAVLEKHGMDWLYENRKHSIIDRLGLPVDKPSKKAAVKPKPPAQSFTEKVRAKIVPGAKVSVQLVRGAKLAHPAVVGDVFMDSNGKPESVSVTFDGGGNIKKGRTQTVPFGNVSLRPGVESRMLTNEQFEGMTKEEAQKTRAAAKEFKKLVIEYPELGFYSGHLEAVAAGPQGEAAIKKARADAYVEAMTALGVHPDKADARDAVTQASLVERLRELTKKPGMERKQYADFQEAKEEGDGEIKAGDLKYGETINIGGEEMRVTDIDKDGVVTLQDGEKFGTQEVHPDESLMIKDETPEPVAPKLRPSDGKGTGELLQGDAAPFNLVAETAADIAKREAREAAEQIAKDAKDAAEAKAKQDKEQGNLFGVATPRMGQELADKADALGIPLKTEQIKKLIADDPDTLREVRARIDRETGGDQAGMVRTANPLENRITPEQDREYLAAVKRGDMETAQRMGDKAAIAAGAHTNADGSVQHFIRGGNERGKTVFPGASFWTLDTEAGRKVAEGYRDSAGDFLGRKIPDAERKAKNADIFRMYRELPEPLKKGHALAAAMHAHGRGSDVSRYYNESAEQTFERVRQLVIKMAKEERWPHPEITQALKDKDWDKVLELSEPHVYLAFEANPIGMTNGEVRDQLTSREQKHRYDALTSRANYFAPFKSITRAYLMFKNPLRLNGTGAITPQSVEQARKDGYDAIWSEGAVGGDTLGRDNRIPEVVVMSAEQVKSADPSTIPLSERFNPESDSIHRTANPADSLRETSTKNAVVDEERAKLGLDPIMSEIRQSHPVVWDAAMRALERDPMAGQSLVNEINGRPRALTATEEAIILRHKINTQTAFYREMEVANDGNASPQDRMSAKLYAAQHLDAMNEIDNATRKSGTEWGRLGAFRQRLAREDYTLVAMLRKRSMATGERIEPGGAEYQFVEKLNKRIAELEAKATQDARNHAAELEQLRETAMEDAMQKMRSDGTPAQKKEREILARIAANMESAKENADAALREMGFGPVANAAGPSGDIIGAANPQDANTLDPKVLKLLSVGGANHLRKLGNDRAKWDEAMLSNYGPKVQPHLDAVWDVSQATLNDFIDGQAPKELRENTKKKILTDAEKQKRILDSIRRKSATPDKVAPYLKQLAKQLVSQGVSDRWTLLTTMETMLKDILPDATRSEIRDSLADYGEGKYRELSTDEVSVKMRRLRAQLQQEAKIEDMMRRGELPWLIGSERGEPDAETRTMIKEVNEIKKELELEATNENQGKSARAAIKTRLRNEIEELEKFIKTRERIPSNRRSVEDDPETAQLRRDVRELRAKYQEIVGVDTMAEEAAKESALEKSIADLQNQIVTGEIEQAAKQQTVDTPEIAALKAQKAALLEQRKALRSPSTEDIERKKEQALLDRITKLSARIATGVADAKVGKPTVESANVSAYRDIIKDLNKQLAEIRNPKKSPDQTKLDELDKRIAEVSAKIARGDLSAKQGKPTVDTAEQAVRKDTLRALNKQLADMRKAAKPTLTPDEIALKTWKTRAEKRLIDLRDRTARGDFSKKVRKVMPMDTEALKTKAALEAAKLEFDQANHKAMTANAPWWVKTMDVAQKYRRWAVLTSATVFEKLGMAAVWRTLVFQPIEDAVGSVIRHIPFIKQVAAMAPRHGQGFNTRIQLDGLIKGFASGASEAATHLKKSGNLLTGSKALSWLFGEMDEAKRLTQTPMEMLSGKRKVEPDTAWEIPGVLHAVVKDIPKMVEFHKSVAFRTKWYADRGVDVSDPLMQEKIQIESFQDAMRAISMQDNAVLNKLNRFIRSLGEPDAKTGKVNKWGKVWQTAFKVEFPIVKIPTNIVAEAFEYVSGFPAGLLNVRRAIKDGITNLQPEHADMIMRQLKKGLVGNAILLTGFLLASNIGGYFQHGRKRDPDEVPAGGIRIGSTDIHERALHAPALLILQAGATIARVMDSRMRKSDVDEQGMGAGLVAAALGLADEIPFVKEAFNLSALRNPYQKSHWFGAKARSIVEPTLMQWIAKLRDTDEEGNPIKRQADGFVDEMKMGIPGLRETLDVKQEKVPHARSHRR